MRLIDISPPLTPKTAVWPGDVPFSRHITCAISSGANLDLSSMATTVHVGAHTDAPSHYSANGQGIGERPLEPYIGLCQVIHVWITPGERILPQHVPDEILAPRILFRTGTFPDPEHFNTDFASLSPELVHYLHDQGVQLVGIDTPSIDPYDDKLLLSHHAVEMHDLSILEGICLDDVQPGLYTLVALPLRIPGADASPVRAILVENSGGVPW